MIKYPDIIFDAERMKYPHTGIYHFCLQLGLALIDQHLNEVYSAGFYLPPSVNGMFGDVFAIKQHPFHKFKMPPLTKHKLWHCTYQGTNYYPAANNIKKVLTIHDLNFLLENKGIVKEQRYLSKLQRKINTADAIVAISQFVKKEIEQNLDLKGKEVKVIYNGCNINDHVLSQKPALLSDKPYLFSIGTIARKKNFHVLPGCLLHNDYNLLIAGICQDDDYRRVILEEANRLGVADRVYLIGAVNESEKYWLLQNCELFLFPSVAEGFGLPVIEAMRFGKKVLLSKSTSLPEIGGPHAFYFDGFDPELMAENTMAALGTNNEVLAGKIIEWSNNFSWQKAAIEYFKVYDELLR